MPLLRKAEVISLGLTLTTSAPSHHLLKITVVRRWNDLSQLCVVEKRISSVTLFFLSWDDNCSNKNINFLCVHILFTNYPL